MDIDSSQEVDLPPEIDIKSYGKYPDLVDLTPDELVLHFTKHGVSEGRVASPAALRETF